MTQWKLTGTYFETCNCEVACPCVFASPPTEGVCTAIVAWHVKHGMFGDVALDGLNVALLVDATGNMVENKWKVAAYIDEKASEAQMNALLTIFSGQAGGHPAVLASFFGEHLGTKSVPMHYQGNGKNRSLKIPESSTLSSRRWKAKTANRSLLKIIRFALPQASPRQSRAPSISDWWTMDTTGRFPAATDTFPIFLIAAPEHGVVEA